MAITDADLTDLLPEVDVEQLIGECYTPFPNNVIKIRQDAGTGNKALSYVGHPDYTRRLDALFPFAWDFRTEVAGITDSAVSVKGSLSITLVDGRTITRENYGHGQINKGFPLGDALKTAAVDAQKKCCSMFRDRAAPVRWRRPAPGNKRQWTISRPTHQRPAARFQ